MADNDTTPPAATGFEPAAPLKTAGVNFNPESNASAESGPSSDATDSATSTSPKQAIKDGAAKVQQQATDKIYALADDGKARAGNALDQFAQLLTDAAAQVDEKLGEQYGQYARSAADTVTGFSGQIKDKQIDDLLDDARAFVRNSPAVAIGVAAALGFVAARVVQSGLDPRDA